MAGSMWRMNGMAGVLLLCTLLLSNEVMCQDETTVEASTVPAADPTTGGADTVTGDATVPDASAIPSVTAGDQSAASVPPGNTQSSVTIVDVVVDDSNQEGGTSGPTAAPSAGGNEVVEEVKEVIKPIVPTVTCVDKEKIQETHAVKATLSTSNCAETERIIKENAAPWCQEEECNIEIFQDGNTVLVASKEADLYTVASALRSEQLKDKLGVTKTDVPSSPNSSVFVGILVTGLLAAGAIVAGYFKCQRRGDTKGVRLAEEAYPVDPENQGNTLVSVAPLNPPPETQEKPSVNGESPEAAKTEPPPTNGHSTTKTADTEL